MKKHALVLFLLAALTLTLLAGCQSANMDTPITGAPRTAAPLTNVTPATDPTTPQPTEAKSITAAEAEAIALAHAGLQRENVRFDRTELDRDDGILEYEVEFRYGNWEYSYDIDAKTGKIIEFEKEWDR